MMAALFVLMGITIILVYFKRRNWAIAFLLITLTLSWFMLWFHASDTLNINW